MIRAADNPFATGRTEELLRFDPRLAGSSWDALWERWEAVGKRAAVIGPHGSGKSTFLEAWKEQLEHRGVHCLALFLNGSQRELGAADWERLESSRDLVVLIDGVEQLRFRARRRLSMLLREAAGVLELRHRSSRLPTLLELRPEPELMAECVRRISPAHAEAFAKDLPLWWAECRGNIREILLRCFDSVARQRNEPANQVAKTSACAGESGARSACE